MTDRSQIDPPAPGPARASGATQASGPPAADDETRVHATTPSATAVADDRAAVHGTRPAHVADPGDPGAHAPGDGSAAHAQPPFSDGAPDADDPVDWDDEWDDGAPAESLPERPRRRLVTPATVVLAGVVLAGAGFIGGVQVQKHSGSDAGGGFGARAGMAGGAPGGAAGSGAPRGRAAGGATGGPIAGAGGFGDGGAAGGATGAASGGSTTGTVANVKGSRIYVTGTDGTTVEVTVGDQATVSRLSKSSAGGVHPGDTIVVQGTEKADGGIAATTVQAAASGLTLGGGGFGARPGAGAAGGASAGGSSSGSSSRGGSSSGGSSDAVDQLFDGG